MINKLKTFRLLMLSLLSVLLFVGCAESITEQDSNNGYGYAQFQLLKESYSRAETDNLDFLNDAKKIRVTLSSASGSTITQTLILSAYDAVSAEYGLRSDKIELLVGNYDVKSFVIYDNLDEILYSEYECEDTFAVTQGGLSVTPIALSATHYGNVTFSFSKKFSGDEISNASRAVSEVTPFLFTYVGKISLTLADEYNHTHTIENIPVSYTLEYSRDENNNIYQEAILSSKKSYRIPSKEWSVKSYTLKTSLKAWIANSPASDVIDCNFEITGDYKQAIDIPLVVTTEDEKIQDYRALKKIWEALGGEQWNYQGQYFAKGANWDFNKDIDMWGQQPGVTINSKGRVVAIDVSDFGARGYVPAELGQLTELSALSIGTHNDGSGGNFDPRSSSAVAQAISPELRTAFTKVGVEIPGGFTAEELASCDAEAEKKSAPATRADVSSGTVTSDVTSLPAEIGGLTKLQTLYIANTTMATLPDELSMLTDLSTLEIYNLPNMTEAPAVFEKLPQSLISINISENPQLPAAEILKVIKMLTKSPAASSIQLFYCNSNSLELLPASLGNMTKLALVQFVSNKISTVESMPTLRPTDVNLSGNKITSIPDDFCNTDDIESFAVSHNKLESFPNIFNASQIPISSVSLAHNKIKAMPADFKGINVQTLDMSYNYLEEYPAEFAKTNSAVNTINMSYNKIKGFAKDCFDYENSILIQSLDFQFNHIEKLPDVWGNHLPFLYGLDLSYNRFDHFPYGALYSPMLTVFIFRGQRDAEGNRIMKEWPLGVYKHTGLRALFLGSNDIRQVDDTISFLINTLDISDNPNISIDMSFVCNYIQAGMYVLYYDKTQDIRQCPILGIIK